MHADLALILQERGAESGEEAPLQRPDGQAKQARQLGPVEGLIELRGRGIISRPFVRSAPLHLVIDLVDSMERMVEEDALIADLEGVTVARCPVPRTGKIDSRHQLLLIREALKAFGPAGNSRKKTA